MKAALLLSLLLLAACGGPESSNSGSANSEAANAETVKTEPGSPVGVRFDQYGSADALARSTETLSNPFSGDAGAAQAGEVLFAAMNCDGCHGGGALGFVGPSLVDGRWRYGGADGKLYQSIVYGRPRGMPAYGGMLPDTTVWQLVTYIQSQPVPAFVPTIAWP